MSAATLPQPAAPARRAQFHPPLPTLAQRQPAPVLQSGREPAQLSLFLRPSVTLR